jgi:hypothetical protein
LLLHGQVVFGLRAYYHGDITLQELPWQVFGASQVRAGNFSPWFDANGCGYPAWADGQVEILYPPNLIRFLPLPRTVMYGLSLYLHYVLAMAGLYVLARSRGATRSASLCGGLLFAMGGGMGARVNQLCVVETASYLPWVWYLVGRWRREGRPLLLAILAVVSGLQLLAVFPQVWMFTLVSGMLLGLTEGLLAEQGRRWWARAKTAVASLVAPAGALAFGVALAAVQLVPMAQVAMESVRARPSWSLVTSFSLTPPKMLGMVLWGPVPREFAAFMGVAALLLVLAVTWAARSRREMAAFWVVGLFAVLMAMSAYNPVYHVMWKLPLVGWFRAAARWLLVWCAAMSVLAAMALTGLQERKLRAGSAGRLWAVFALVGIVCAAVAVAILMGVAAPPAVVRFAVRHLFPFRESLPPEYAKEALQAAARNIADFTRGSMAHLLAAALALGAAARALREAARDRPVAKAALVLAAAMVVEAFVFSWSMDRTAPREMLDRPPRVVEFMNGEGRVVTAETATRWVTDPFIALAAAPLEDLRHELDWLVPDCNVLFGVRSVDSYLRLTMRRFDALTKTVAGRTTEPVVAALLGGEWLLTDLPPGRVDPAWKLLGSAGEQRVYRNSRYRGLVWVASRVAPTARIGDAIAAARRGDEALLDTAFCSLAPLVVAAPAGERRGEAALSRADGRGMAARATAHGPAVIVFASNWYRGVTARVDGRCAEVLPCDIAFCGVEVPAGTHEVELIYPPTGANVGGAISALALLLLVSVAGLSRRRRRTLSLPGVP